LTATQKAHLSVLGANIIFGINYSVVKLLTTNYMHPWAMNLMRVGISSILLWICFLFQQKQTPIQKKHIPRFILCAITGVAINQLLFTKGLSLTTSIHASLLALGTPIFVTVIAAWLLADKLTSNKTIGLLLGVSGAILLIVFKSKNIASSSAPNMVAGDIMVLVNAISYSFYFVWVKPLMSHYSPIQVMRITFTIGSFFILPFGLGPAIHTSWHAMDMQAWLALIYVVVGATFLAYLLNMLSLKTLGPGITGSYIYTQPLFAAAIGIIFLSEPVGMVQILSALLIGIGVYIVNKKKPIF
jgi:drug/metabolite transporter (DMT)-like permease